MSFGSRKVRVQLPCGEQTVYQVAADFDCPMRTECPPGSFFCDPSTCVFGAASEVGPGGLRGCRFGSDPPVRPEPLVLDAERLAALRRHLERQLEEIDIAEQAMEERSQGQQ